MRTFRVFLLIILFPLAGQCQTGFESNMLFNSKIILLLPKGLKGTERNKGQSPDYLFASKASKALLTVKATAQTISDNDIPAYADSVISEIKKTSVFIDDGISLNDGKNISFIKYSSESGEDKGFNYVFFGSMNEKLVIFSFNCAAKTQKKWEKEIDDVVEALRIKE